MLRPLFQIGFLLMLAVGGAIGIVYYRDHFTADRRIAELEQQRQQLQQVVARLSDERRVAEVLVTDQKIVNGSLQTTLLFVEYAHDGTPLPPKSFTFAGKGAHFDAMVIKFDRGFVEQGDALRGHSIVLFKRIFGDQQPPVQAFAIDPPGQIPDYYRGADPQAGQFEQDLWTNFWKLADDPEYRKEKGVRVANPEGVWRDFEPDRLYTITLESSGGINISSEPLKGIYREALRRHTAA